VLRDLEEAARGRAAAAPLAEDIARTALAELRRIDEELEARRQLAWELTLNLRGSRALVAMPHGRWIRHAYTRYVVRTRGLFWKRSLDETIETLRGEGVACGPACGAPLHLDVAVLAALPGDARLEAERFTAATTLAGELIAIPLHSGLTSRDMVDLARILRHVEERST
jgi:dTDP-4-amino-4,6-dideoxygalactose transaminase